MRCLLCDLHDVHISSCHPPNLVVSEYWRLFTLSVQPAGREVKNAWSHDSSRPYVFILCSINEWNEFTFSPYTAVRLVYTAIRDGVVGRATGFRTLVETDSDPAAGVWRRTPPPPPRPFLLSSVNMDRDTLLLPISACAACNRLCP